MGGSECPVAILDQAIDSNTGTASIMNAGSNSSAAGPEQTPENGSSLITSVGSSSSDAPMAPAAMQGGGLAWVVATAERKRHWEVPSKACPPSKTDNILTLAMDKLAVEDKTSGYATKLTAERREIIKEANKPGGTASLSRNARNYANPARLHDQYRHNLENFLGTTIRGEADLWYKLLNSQEEINRLKEGQPAPRKDP